MDVIYSSIYILNRNKKAVFFQVCQQIILNTKLVMCVCVCVCEELKSSLYLKKYDWLHTLAYANILGLEMVVGRVKKKQHEKLIQIVLIAAYLRRTKSTRCQYHYWTIALINENKLFEDWIIDNGL